MITKYTYADRRSALRNDLQSGIIILVTNSYLPRNYSGNTLPFRQDSNFLYYTGINVPGLLCILDCDSGEEYLCGQESTIEDAIWSGKLPTIKELADSAGISNTLTRAKLPSLLNKNYEKIHYLPPYTANRLNELSEMLNKPATEIKNSVSKQLINAVINQRMYKTPDEVTEIETVLSDVTGPMFLGAMKMALPGIYEYEIMAEMQKIAYQQNLEQAFPIICSIRGEVLHNISFANKLKPGDMLLTDAGVESALHYASDITRTTPVGGKFSNQQREIYEIVLNAQLNAIKLIRPGFTYREIHMITATEMAKGLKQLGLMKGDIEEAVNVGAHALFFPHGLGHMLGLDVHDMEDLGENYVGYGEEIERSSQFGTAYLRLARTLEAGFVLTVEPGIYFNPVLISQWESEKKFDQFIAYSKVKEYLNFGGIRIEDDILVTSTGSRVLGTPIPKTLKEIESLF